MANKKINELDLKSLVTLTDLMIVGDPGTGTSYKTTLQTLQNLIAGASGVTSFNGRTGAVIPTSADYSISLLSDVLLTSLSNGQILQYDSVAAKWKNVPVPATGITSLGGQTGATQLLLTGSAGTQFNIVSTGNTHTFNIPIASGTNTGLLSNTDWTAFNSKQSAISLTTTGNSGAATFTSGTLNIPNYTLAGLGGISLTSLSATSPLLYNNTTGAFSIQVANSTQNGYLSSTDWNTFNSKGSGTVTSVSVVSANGFSGTVANAGTTPAITLTTTITGLLKGNGTAISSAVANTDYQSPITLTTTGTSGVATFNGTTLNIPNYGATAGMSNPMTTLGDIIVGDTGGTPIRLAGNTLAAKRFLTQTGTGSASAIPTWGTIATSDIGSGQALTETDDTNVTLTLGGTPSTALLQAVSLTLGWTGQLAIARGGTGLSALGTQGQLLRVNTGATALEYFTPTYISSAITSIGTAGNLQTGATQTLATGTTGTDFNISSGTNTHTFNIPDASATARGLVTNLAQTFGGTKSGSFAGTFSTTSGQTATNFFVNNGTAQNSGSTVAGRLFGGNSAVSFALTSGATSSGAIAANDGLAYWLLAQWTTTTAASGTHPTVSVMAIKAPVINAGTAQVTNSATLYIEGANTGTATVTNKYALWVDNDTVRFDGAFELQNIANTTTANVLYYDATTKRVTYGATPSGGSGITSLNSLTAATQTFANDTNVTITSATSTHTIGWSGQLSVARGGTGLSALGTANQLLRVNAGATALEYFTPSYITGNETITISGDASGSGTTAIALTLATVNSNVGTFNNVTVNAKGLVTAASNVSYLTTAVTTINFGTTGLTPSTATSGAVTVAGTLVVANGGTGATTLTGVIIGNGTSAMTSVSGTASQLLRRNAGNTAYEFFTIAGSDITGAALTKTDDTNVTLTLGGTPATSLLRAASLTLGWTGTLAVGRGGSGASTLTGVLIGNGTSAFTGVAGTASQLLRRNAGNTAYEFFTPTYLTAAITSLGGQTGATQTFTNDTNVTITSATNNHTLGWSGTLAVSRGGIGVGTLTGFAIGNGTSAFTSVPSANVAYFGSAITGTPSASTYLRGDGSWGSVSISESDLGVYFVDKRYSGAGAAIITGLTSADISSTNTSYNNQRNNAKRGSVIAPFPDPWSARNKAYDDLQAGTITKAVIVVLQGKWTVGSDNPAQNGNEAGTSANSNVTSDIGFSSTNNSAVASLLQNKINAYFYNGTELVYINSAYTLFFIRAYDLTDTSEWEASLKGDLTLRIIYGYKNPILTQTLINYPIHCNHFGAKLYVRMLKAILPPFALSLIYGVQEFDLDIDYVEGIDLMLCGYKTQRLSGGNKKVRININAGTVISKLNTVSPDYWIFCSFIYPAQSHASIDNQIDVNVNIKTIDAYITNSEFDPCIGVGGWQFNGKYVFNIGNIKIRPGGNATLYGGVIYNSMAAYNTNVVYNIGNVECEQPFIQYLSIENLNSTNTGFVTSDVNNRVSINANQVIKRQNATLNAIAETTNLPAAKYALAISTTNPNSNPVLGKGLATINCNVQSNEEPIKIKGFGNPNNVIISGTYYTYGTNKNVIIIDRDNNPSNAYLMLENCNLINQDNTNTIEAGTQNITDNHLVYIKNVHATYRGTTTRTTYVGESITVNSNIRNYSR